MILDAAAWDFGNGPWDRIGKNNSDFGGRVRSGSEGTARRFISVADRDAGGRVASI